MNSAANKKEFFYLVVLVLTFITVVFGATFAIYALIHRQEEGTSAVYTGNFTIKYLSGDIINFHYLKPTDNPDLSTTDNVYKNNFSVSNTGSLDGSLDVYIEVNKNEFSKETLMYALYNGDEELIASDFLEGSDEIKLVGNIVLESSEKEDFVLLIWLKESGEDQNSEMQKTLTGQIRVEGINKVD